MIPYTNFTQYAQSKGWATPYAGVEPRVVAEAVQTASTFVPAKNMEELKTRMGVHAERVNLEGMSLDGGNEILRGLHNAQQAGLPAVKMPFIGFSDKPLGKALAKGGSNGIRFQKTIINNPSKNLKKWQAQHTAKINAEIARNQAIIKRHMDSIASGTLRRQEIASKKGLITRAQNNILELKATQRWTFTSHSAVSDTVNNLISHEYGHVIYYRADRYGLDTPFRNALTRNNVTRIERLSVSEYGASSPTELFAEVTSAIAGGQKDTIPPNILKAYYEIVNSEAVNALR